MVKRTAITGLTRDKEYDLTRGKSGSKIIYFSANPNGEAEIIKVQLKPRPRLKNLAFEYDFSQLAIKGKSSMGNILTKNAVHKITLKEKGLSTLGGRKIWFDEDVFRLNVDGRGKYLGEFSGDDHILVVTKLGKFRISNFDLSNHFEEDWLILEKFVSGKVLSVIYFDETRGYYYLKRFKIDPTEREQNFLPENTDSKLISITEMEYPRFEIRFGGKNKNRESEIVEVAEFIGVKSHKAKGKRLTTYQISEIKELIPVVKKEAEIQEINEEEIPEVLKPGQEVSFDPDDSSQMKLDL